MELSEQVKACQDVVRVVVPVILERAARTGAALDELWKPLLEEGQSSPDGKLQMNLIAIAIERCQSVLEDADMAHARELGDDAEPRKKRDAAVSAAYRELTSLRDDIVAVFGDTGIKALGMSGNTPQDGPRLERLIRDVAGRLRDENVSLGTAKGRVSLDRKAASDELIPLASELKETIAVVDKEAAEAKGTQDARNAAIDLWMDKVPKLCALARGLLLVAGDVEGAALIVSTPKPTSSRT
jgi:hypothetical protein